METSEKVRKGIVHHYGNLVGTLGATAESLSEDIYKGRINVPDLNEEDLKRIREQAGVRDWRLPQGTLSDLWTKYPENKYGGAVSYATVYASLEAGDVAGRLLRHPLVDTYLKEAIIPIHLRRGLTEVRVLTDALRKLYSTRSYWEAIPRDNDTEPFYRCAEIFDREISRKLESLEDILQKEGLVRDNELKIGGQLQRISTASTYILLIGDYEIAPKLEFSNLQKDFNLADIDPTIAALFPSTEVYNFRNKGIKHERKKRS